MSTEMTLRLPVLYVGGPMSNIEDYNRPAFAQAAAALRAAGFKVVSPGEFPEVDGWQWQDYLRQDLSAMLAQCAGVATLPGWEESRGATLEVSVAAALQWEVASWEAWCARVSVARQQALWAARNR